jgi:hypothetical protein
MRVLIRDEEWLVKRVDTNSHNGYTLTVTGFSALVKNKEAIFIDKLEEIAEIKPEGTDLVPDHSPFFYIRIIRGMLRSQSTG